MEKIMLDDENEFKKNMIRIIKGAAISIIITLILLLIFSLILTYTELSEKSIPIVIIGITGVSILIRKLNQCAKNKKKRNVIWGFKWTCIYDIYLCNI